MRPSHSEGIGSESNERKARESNPHDLTVARFSGPARRTLSGCPPSRVDPAGVEPASPARQASVFPLDHGPVQWRRWGSNPHSSGCGPDAFPG